MTVIIDYGAGNIKSVEKALLSLGQEVVITDDADTILNAERIILPGVGAFGNAMAQLEKTGLDEVIREAVRRKIPFLGICLGLQLLFEKSDEALGVKGLGVLKGEVKKIPAKKGLKIPHMGWNSLHFAHNGKLFQGIEEGAYVYFVHSYYLEAEEESIVKASAEYGVHIHASVEKENVFTLGTVNFGYEFGQNICSKIGVRNLRVGVNLTDIVRWSNVKIERGTTYLYSNGFEFTLSTTF